MKSIQIRTKPFLDQDKVRKLQSWRWVVSRVSSNKIKAVKVGLWLYINFERVRVISCSQSRCILGSQSIVTWSCVMYNIWLFFSSKRKSISHCKVCFQGLGQGEKLFFVRQRVEKVLQATIERHQDTQLAVHRCRAETKSANNRHKSIKPESWNNKRRWPALMTHVYFYIKWTVGQACVNFLEKSWHQDTGWLLLVERMRCQWGPYQFWSSLANGKQAASARL